jgi:hypothetical protein
MFFPYKLQCKIKGDRDKSSKKQNSENPYGGLFIHVFDKPFKMIPGILKNPIIHLRYEMWSLYIEYLQW